MSYDKARTYWDELALIPVNASGVPIRDEGLHNGGTTEFRHDRVWVDTATIEWTADQQVKLLRSLIQRADQNENSRAQGFGAVRRWLSKPAMRMFQLSGSLGLQDPEEFPSIQFKFVTTFDVGSAERVDSALAAYRRFLVRSNTNALQVEQGLARDASAALWANWVGA